MKRVARVVTLGTNAKACFDGIQAMVYFDQYPKAVEFNGFSMIQDQYFRFPPLIVTIL